MAQAGSQSMASIAISSALNNHGINREVAESSGELQRGLALEVDARLAIRTDNGVSETGDRAGERSHVTNRQRRTCTKPYHLLGNQCGDNRIEDIVQEPLLNHSRAKARDDRREELKRQYYTLTEVNSLDALIHTLR